MDFGKTSIINESKPLVSVGVSDEGALSADVTGSEVAAGGVSSNVTVIRGQAGTSSAEILGENDRRTQVIIQNVHAANDLHINVAGETAMTTDFMLPPGASFSFPPGCVCRGAITAIASDIDTDYTVLEFYTP